MRLVVFFYCKRNSIVDIYSLSLLPSHHPDMTKILLKGRKIASDPSASMPLAHDLIVVAVP